MRGKCHGEEVVRTETTWADVAMEIKTGLASSGTAIEESGQASEEDAWGQIEDEYAEAVREVDVRLDALLNGAETEMGTIAAVTDTEFIDEQENVAGIRKTVGMRDAQADLVGERMLEMLGGSEDGGSDAISRAVAASR